MAKILTGKVKLTKMPKTVIVIVERKYRHPLYKKVILRSKKYKVHNEKIDLDNGDIVDIKETKPISKEKHFIVVKKL
jgi:small subunit ribosomal protein S17